MHRSKMAHSKGVNSVGHLDVDRGSSGSVPNQRGSSRTTLRNGCLGMIWTNPGNVPAIIWYDTNTALVYSGTVLVLPWYCAGTVLLTCTYYTIAAPVLYWDCDERALRKPHVTWSRVRSRRNYWAQARSLATYSGELARTPPLRRVGWREEPKPGPPSPRVAPRRSADPRPQQRRKCMTASSIRCVA